jgi:hypothetical protein
MGKDRMTFDPLYVVRAGQTYLLPATEEIEQLHLLTLEMRADEWLCLCLETGVELTIPDFFFDPDKLVVRE